MRKLAVFIFIIGVTFRVISFAPTVSLAQPNSSYKLETSQSYDTYQVRIYGKEEEGVGRKGYFEILQNGKRVYFQKGYKFRIGLIYTDAEFKEMGLTISNDIVAMGKDITGRGVPNLVINEWTGGAHCCHKFYVFEVGKRFKKIAVLDAGDGDLSHFEDLRKNNNLQFITSDWTFAYWRAGFAQSPAPGIILSYRNGAYTLDFDLMRKSPPTQGEIEDKIIEVQNDESWQGKEAPPLLWGYMLDLIYSGNANVAWTFFEKAWLIGVPGKKEFKKDFQARLRKSRYSNQVKKMNKEEKD